MICWGLLDRTCANSGDVRRVCSHACDGRSPFSRRRVSVFAKRYIITVLASCAVYWGPLAVYGGPLVPLFIVRPPIMSVLQGGPVWEMYTWLCVCGGWLGDSCRAVRFWGPPGRQNPGRGVQPRPVLIGVVRALGIGGWGLLHSRCGNQWPATEPTANGVDRQPNYDFSRGCLTGWQLDAYLTGSRKAPSLSSAPLPTSLFPPSTPLSPQPLPIMFPNAPKMESIILLMLTRYVM